MTTEELEKVFLNEPLIQAGPTLSGLVLPFKEDGTASLYYGTGLTTPRAPSIGLPFDVLILIFVAERLRRLFGLSEIHHHIADTHALTNDFCTPEGVAHMSENYRATLERIAKATGIPLRVHLSSEFDSTPEYQSILDGIKTDKGEYVRRELADMLWYKQQHKVMLKLGWLMQAGEQDVGFDERLYDNEFRVRCDAALSFAYTVPGRTLNRQRSRVSPYISIADENRILFTNGELVAEKFARGIEDWNGDKTAGGTLRHLNSIMRLWDRLSETKIPPSKNVLERVQMVINLICA
jgi:hypothetical protein